MSPTYEVPLPVRYETADVAPFLLLQPEINLKENQFDEQLFYVISPPLLSWQGLHVIGVGLT